LPTGGPCATVGRRILLAWDGGRAAARAAQQALPLLKDAAQVRIAVCRPAAEPHAADDALAADPRPWLARHGVPATLDIHAVGTPWRLSRSHAVGEQLLALAREGGADLLVMGGYGHAPLRELLLGGVSRTVLATMQLPVLMAH
jgi:nucleotide-binding universal stress UspA family protein